MDLPRRVKYTRYPGPWLMRSSLTPWPTDRTSPSRPRATRCRRSTITARDLLLLSPCSHRVNVSVAWRVAIRQAYPQGYIVQLASASMSDAPWVEILQETGNG